MWNTGKEPGPHIVLRGTYSRRTYMPMFHVEHCLSAGFSRFFRSLSPIDRVNEQAESSLVFHRAAEFLPPNPENQRPMQTFAVQVVVEGLYFSF